MMLSIDIFMSEGCGSYYALRENINRALAEVRISADISYHTICYDEAVSRNIKGSPTILLNGIDPFDGGNAPGVT